jgi:HD-GYP domain-containing protein (c-di-GMP phosphodiesterase class II)
MTRLSDLVRAQSKGSPIPGTDREAQAHSFQPPSLHTPQNVPPASSQAEAFYRKAEQELSQLERGVRHHAILNLDVLHSLADALMVSVRDSDELIRKVLSGRQGAPFVQHAISVAVLATKIGLGLQYETVALKQLALSALVHDVGMMTIPEAVLAKAEPLTTQERMLIDQHPKRGFDLIMGLGSQFEWLAMIVRQEHERWRGQGYPAQLNGSEIHDHALVIGLADVFDAMISPRPYRKQLLPHHAVRELLVKGKEMFPSELLKILVDQLSMYPLGTAVRLNTGEIGVVSKLNRQYPLRPELHVDQAAANGLVGPAKTIDLSQASAVHIVEVLRPKDARERA